MTDLPSRSDISALLNRATRFETLGQWQPAENVYRGILQTEANQFDALIGLATIAQHHGDICESLELFQHAVGLQPEHPNARTMLGICFARIGQHADAEACFRDVIEISPDFAKAHVNLGVTFAEQQRYEDALRCFEKAVEIKSDYAEAHHNMGTTWMHMGQTDDAIMAFRCVLTLRPDHADAMTNLGLLLHGKRESEEAYVLLRQATRLQPGSIEAHNNLGLVCNQLGRFEESEVALDQALRLSPGHVEAHVNMANLYRDMGSLEESLACYDHALRLSPDLPSARWNRSLVLLQMGNFEEGWQEYEWRWKRGTPAREFDQPRWNGESLQGRTILVHMEQGLGDMIMFIRYAQPLKERGARVVVECPQKMIPLFSTNPYIDQLVAEESGSLPEFDVHCPLMSLPGNCGTTLDSIPNETPYLFPPEELVEKWKKRLEEYPGFRIGIAWQGNPDHPNDRHRSMPLRDLSPLAEIPDVQLISLQQGFGRAQIEEVRGEFPVVELAKQLDIEDEAFLNTAAIMQSMDTIVTVDTSIVHLAGALGRRTMLLISPIVDWRWQRRQSNTQWYPSVKLALKSDPVLLKHRIHSDYVRDDSHTPG